MTDPYRYNGTVLPLRRGNVDTDQIVPARFLTRSRRTGYADALFADWRDDPLFVLDRIEHGGATVLVAGTDFGTGSSREHAVWALLDWGFEVVIAPRFGDIFHRNALLNGLVVVTLPETVVENLWDLVDADPALTVTVDLEDRTVRFGCVVQPIDLGAAELELLLRREDPIELTEAQDTRIRLYESARRDTLPRTVPMR